MEEGIADKLRAEYNAVLSFWMAKTCPADADFERLLGLLHKSAIHLELCDRKLRFYIDLAEANRKELQELKYKWKNS